MERHPGALLPGYGLISRAVLVAFCRGNETTESPFDRVPIPWPCPRAVPVSRVGSRGNRLEQGLKAARGLHNGVEIKP